MSGLARRLAATAVLCGAAGYLAAAAVAQLSPQRVELVASKFHFSATEIRVRRGRPVTVALSSNDFVHGFALPDFNVRADGVPGKIVEFTFTPDRTGRFIFLCDNFCGEDHDRMSGFLIVSAD